MAATRNPPSSPTLNIARPQVRLTNLVTGPCPFPDLLMGARHGCSVPQRPRMSRPVRGLEIGSLGKMDRITRTGSTYSCRRKPRVDSVITQFGRARGRKRIKCGEIVLSETV